MRMLPLLLAATLVAGAARAESLQQALRHWTGVDATVSGSPPAVTVTLPPGGPVPSFTARASQASRAGDRGWQLGGITLPSPLSVKGNGTLSFTGQHSQAWLGERTAELNAALDGVSRVDKGRTSRLDHATLRLSSLGGPVELMLALLGPHVPDRNGQALLPKRIDLRGHTTPAGATALAAMASGERAGVAPVSVDRLEFDVGPARFTGHGTVTVNSPTDRHGAIELSATGFGDLTRAIEADGRAYTVLLILRQLARQRDDRLNWTIEFDGEAVRVNGIDVSMLGRL